MIILEDTRQQENKHKLKHEFFKSNGITWNRTKLYCGDYTLPTNQSICIDTKKDLQEIVGNVIFKQMSKKDISNAILNIFKDSIGQTSISEIYHIITDEDEERFIEKEITEWCVRHNCSSVIEKQLQKLYIKRYGSFHREVKRAENSGIHLIILCEHGGKIKSLEDVKSWVNPRTHLWEKKMRQQYNIPKDADFQVELAELKSHGAKINRGPTTGEELYKAMVTMSEKYGVEWVFCDKKSAGAKVVELLGGKVNG